MPMWCIQQAKKEEFKIVENIIREAYKETKVKFRLLEDNYPTFAGFESVKTLEKAIDRGKLIFILFLEKEPIGVVRIVLDINAFHKGYIERLAVLPKYQHKGYGTKLMEFAERTIFANKLECIELSVIKGNYNVEKFFVDKAYEMIYELSSVQLPYDIKYFQIDKHKYKLRLANSQALTNEYC